MISLNKFTKDLLGNIYGRLRVIGFAGYFPHSINSSKKEARWFAECGCNKSIIVSAHSLESGNTCSCGCARDEARIISGINNRKHGYGNDSKLYRLWTHIKGRCSNSNSSLKHRNAKYYILKGVTVCDEWLTDFVAFKEWALANGYKEGLQIDRIDNSKGYCPYNCRFVLAGENCRNKTNNRILTYKGETKLLSEWADKLHISISTLWHRLDKGLPEEKVFYSGKLR